jgi:hypothetical protein
LADSIITILDQLQHAHTDDKLKYALCDLLAIKYLITTNEERPLLVAKKQAMSPESVPGQVLIIIGFIKQNKE